MVAGTLIIKESEYVDITIFAEYHCGGNEQMAHITNGGMSLQSDVSNDDLMQSYIGQFSANMNADAKCAQLYESQKIIMKVIFILPTQNIGVPKFHGHGHIVFKRKCNCMSVQLCLEDFVITNDTHATATYSGCVEKNYIIDPRNDTQIDTCASFMVTCQAE